MPIYKGMGEIVPTKDRENELKERGYKRIAGFDCSGNNSGWGPMIGCLIIPKDFYNPSFRDAKWLWNGSMKNISVKNPLFACENIILENVEPDCIVYAQMDMSERNEINNDLKAEQILMERVLNKAKIKPDYLIVDGSPPSDKNSSVVSIACEHEYVISADKHIFVVNCAGLLAQSERIRVVENERIEFNKEFCQGIDRYLLQKNQGYLTPDHIKVLEKYKASHLHSRRCIEKYGCFV